MTHAVQWSDTNIGPAEFKNYAPDELLITKIFYTVQGEGPYAGYPAVFVRLAGCNRGRKEDMGCKFCDTDFRVANGRRMTFTDIQMEMRNSVSGLLGKQTPLVVITGGEPMMQDNLAAFCTYLRQEAGWSQIQIESNGDRLADRLPRVPWVSLVVSPKVTREGYRTLKPEVLDRVNFLKFLVEAVPGSPYYSPPDWASAMQQPVFLSPITHYLRRVEEHWTPNAWDFRTVDNRQTYANYRHAAGLAMQHGFRLSMQTHLFFGIK